jgi:hypothetical protein
MREKVVAAVWALGLCSVAADARATDVVYGGNFCTPVIADLVFIEHNQQFGVHNVSTSTATVQCPFVNAFSGALIITEVDVTVYDRNPSADVSCTLRGIALDGTSVWEVTRSSTGSGPGHQLLVFRPNQRTLGTLNMTCAIPGVTNSGLSHLTTYRVISTP